MTTPRRLRRTLVTFALLAAFGSAQPAAADDATLAVRPGVPFSRGDSQVLATQRKLFAPGKPATAPRCERLSKEFKTLRESTSSCCAQPIRCRSAGSTPSR